MDRPVIGVSTYWATSATWGTDEESAAVLLPLEYIRMIQDAGGTAVMLPPGIPASARQVVSRLDGLVIAGGADVDPERYGAPRSPLTGPPAPERDMWECALIEAALISGTPLLGVCRGMQLLNVVLGGTLIQHIPGHETPGMFAKHAVTPLQGTLLHSLLPETTAVATSHHQAVDVIGAGLRVSAYAGDGTVEAVEGTGAQWVLGVQWHPEMDGDLRVATGLLQAAAGTPIPQTHVMC